MFPCRLEGGPYDGDQGTWRQGAKLPEMIYAYRCPDCRGVHWAPIPETHRAEPYQYDRIESGYLGEVAVYVHADIDLSGLPFIRECVNEPVAV